MRNKLTQIIFLIAIIVNLSACIVTTPYDRQFSHRPRPSALMHRPHPVKSPSRYSFVWNPFGNSSSRSREHWPRHHGSYDSRARYWPRHFVPHPHYHRVKYHR